MPEGADLYIRTRDHQISISVPAPNQHLITHLNRIEILFLFLISFALIVLSWFGFEENGWMIGYIAVLGIMVPILYKSHLEASEFVNHKPWWKLGVVALPAILITVNYILGLLSQSTQQLEIAGETYSVFTSPSRTWAPTQVSLDDSLNTQTGYVGMYLIALLLLFIPRTKLFFERLMQVVFFNNLALCAVFITGEFIASFDSFRGLNVGLSATFTDSDAWPGFLILWLVSLWGHLLSHFHIRKTDRSITNSPRWVLPATALTITCILFKIDNWLAIWLFGALAIAIGHYARLMQKSSMTRRRYGKSRWIITYAFAFACVAISIWSTVQFSIHIASQVAGDPNTEQETGKTAGLEAAVRMIAERPITGWGMESFSAIGHYFAEPIDQTLEMPNSDFLLNMLQFGALGCILIASVPLAQTVKYFTKRKRNNVSDYALLAIVIGTTFGIAAAPTAQGAYVFLWLIILFTGIRWADINYAEDEREKRYQKNVKVFSSNTPSRSNSLSVQ